MMERHDAAVEWKSAPVEQDAWPGAMERNRQVLVLSRKRSEEIVIGDNIIVTVLEVRGDKVAIGITAPKKVPVHRREVAEAIRRDQEYVG